MDKITLDRIAFAHPKIREELKADYIAANNLCGKGSRLRFAYVLRTPEEQDALYAKGRTTPGKIVTNAKAWQSIHNYALAFDIVMLYDNDKNGTFEEASWSMTKDYDGDGIPEWIEVVNYFKSRGYTWGGDWKFKDAPHFQKDFGYSWKSLKLKLDSGDYFTEIVQGKEIKYVNI